MKPTALVLIAAVLALALPMALPAQEKKGAAETSITGCFNKGDAAGYYVLTDEKTSKKITVTGDAAMLAGHANNHKVNDFLIEMSTFDKIKGGSIIAVRRCVSSFAPEPSDVVSRPRAA